MKMDGVDFFYHYLGTQCHLASIYLQIFLFSKNRGYVIFKSQKLPTNDLKSLLSKGVRYLY